MNEGGIKCAESMRNSMDGRTEKKGHELSSVNTFLSKKPPKTQSCRYFVSHFDEWNVELSLGVICNRQSEFVTNDILKDHHKGLQAHSHTLVTRLTIPASI